MLIEGFCGLAHVHESKHFFLFVIYGCKNPPHKYFSNHCVPSKMADGQNLMKMSVNYTDTFEINVDPKD